MGESNGHSHWAERTDSFRVREVRRATAKDNVLLFVGVAGLVGGFALWVLNRAEAPAAGVKAELAAHVAAHTQETTQLRTEFQTSANRVESKVDKLVDVMLRQGRRERALPAAGAPSMGSPP